jgi:hypothetical protein
MLDPEDDSTTIFLNFGNDSPNATQVHIPVDKSFEIYLKVWSDYLDGEFLPPLSSTPTLENRYFNRVVLD